MSQGWRDSTEVKSSSGKRAQEDRGKVAGMGVDGEHPCSSVAKGSLEVFKSGSCSERDLGWWVYRGD